MPNLKDIRDRIGSVKNTKKITSAMKLVAAAKLRRAQDAVQAARPYAVMMQRVIGELTSRVEEDAHPLLKRREGEANILVILITSDRGLCGGFNANLLRPFARFLRDKADVSQTRQVLTVGRKGAQFVKRTPNLEHLDHVNGVLGGIDFADAKRIAQRAIGMFTRGEVDRVYLVHNEFISAIQTNQVFRQLLPMVTEELGEGERGVDPDQGGEEYIYEPSEEELLARLLPNSVEVTIFQALLESEAAELGSRMTAMDNATNNAEDMIDSLSLQYNRARQAYITKELVEIVSGAESLSG